MPKIELKPEVAEIFKVNAEASIIDTGKWGRINFPELTMEDAEYLAKYNCPYLIRKRKAKVENS